MKVELRDIEDSVRATVTLSDQGKVVIDPSDRQADLEAMTVMAPGAVVVTPEQGEDYLRALPYAFRNPYLRAVLIED